MSAELCKKYKSKSCLLAILIIFCVVIAVFTLRPKRLRKFQQARINALKVLNRDWQGVISPCKEAEVAAE